MSSHRYPTRYSKRCKEKKDLDGDVIMQTPPTLDPDTASIKIQKWYKNIYKKYANFEDFATLEPLSGPLFRIIEQGSIYRFNYLTLAKTWVTQAKIYNPYTNSKISQNNLTRFDMNFNRYYPQKKYDEYRNLRYHIDRIRKNKQEEDEREAFQELQNAVHDAQNDIVDRIAAGLLIRQCLDILSPLFIFGPEGSTLVNLSQFAISFNSLRMINEHAADEIGRRWIQDIRNHNPIFDYTHPIMVQLGSIITGIL